MLTGIKITLDGLMEAVEIEDGNHVSGIQNAIDARFYDVVSIRDGLDLFVDDEGVYTSRLNPVLTGIAQSFGYAGVLFGEGVFFAVNPAEGSTHSLNTVQIATLASRWVDAASSRHTPVAAGLAFLAH
ncbi:DUF3846 domain-containing protein [Plantibacter sp. RU18]|uniref:DUF3846 domain-containing protein n=1 Tax=Plantibacter sp. RU18 TaxID=3158143 RepID=UPI003D362F75